MTDALEKYAEHCGPAVIAKLCRITRLSAAKLLRRYGAEHGTSTYDYTLLRALWSQGWLTHRERYTGLGPTLTQWRRAHPKSTAIILAGGHYVLLRSGRLVEDNGVDSARKRVRNVIWVTPK